MKLTIYNKELEVVGPPSLELLVYRGSNPFIHLLMRSDDVPKAKAQADMLAHFNLRWLESSNEFAFFEYSDEDLQHYIQYAATEHNDKVSWNWLWQMFDRRMKAWPFTQFVQHYVNNTTECITQPRYFFRLLKDYTRSREKIDQEKEQRSHQLVTERHFDHWLDDALINAAKEPGFLVKTRIDDNALWGKIKKQQRLYNLHRAPLFKTPQLEIFTVFNPEDPFHLYYHTGHKP